MDVVGSKLVRCLVESGGKLLVVWRKAVESCLLFGGKRWKVICSSVERGGQLFVVWWKAVESGGLLFVGMLE